MHHGHGDSCCQGEGSHGHAAPQHGHHAPGSCCGHEYGPSHHAGGCCSHEQRRFFSQEEIIGHLEDYLKQLQAEAKGVEEHIARLKKGVED